MIWFTAGLLLGIIGTMAIGFLIHWTKKTYTEAERREQLSGVRGVWVRPVKKPKHEDRPLPEDNVKQEKRK